MPHTKKSGGTKKYGRNSTKCGRYEMAQKREKGHVRKIRKHLEFHTNDKPARVALKMWEAKLR